ncbi:MAG: helicase-related protein [Candidatus Poseidoniales archaeon]
MELPDSKLSYTAKLINDMCKDGKKVIVFSQFIETAHSLSNLIIDNLVGTITGETKSDARIATLTGLEYSKGGAIVMTDVGGEGLDMQFVDCIINHDLPWNPMILEQRIGRLDRIGRDARDIEVHNVLLKNSLDSHIIRVLEEKEKIVSEFNGYGKMINTSKESMIVNSSMDFSSLTESIFANDLSELYDSNYDKLISESKEIAEIINELEG